MLWPSSGVNLSWKHLGHSLKQTSSVSRQVCNPSKATMMHRTLKAVSTSFTKPQVRVMKYLLSLNTIKVCISSLLLLSGFSVQAQRDTLHTLHHVHFSDATPKLWLNLTASRTISFGPFAKDDCSKPEGAFDFTESKGGFAGRGVFFEASLGVRIKGNLGLLFKASHQQIDVVHKAIRQKLEAEDHSVSWEINTWVWKINTFALGLTSGKSLGRRKRYLVGWQALAGLTHSSSPAWIFKVQTNWVVISAISCSMVEPSKKSRPHRFYWAVISAIGPGGISPCSPISICSFPG